MAKYCHKASPLKSRASGRHSPTWKRLLKVRHQAHPHVRWVVGQGKIYFWDDIWIGDVALRELCIDDRAPPLTMVSDFIRDGTWDEAKLHMLQDQAGLSWMDEFSLATTWETIRSQRPIIPGLDIIWKAGLTKSIAIFNWRLLSNRIPVDTKLQWRGIEMASKCQCCPIGPNVESLQHLFIQGRGATSIWREFDGWFMGSSPPIRINDTIPERVDVWSRRTQQQDKKHLCHALPYLIMWFIWAERNRSRHDQVPFKPYNMIWQVQTFIRNGMAIGTIKPKPWTGDGSANF
ncbi:uncharacterized protein LOC121760608 [Salvia splendens]|uniref:uncharacterized protein LOC121760608 n=1 Tax=Salvia splendens TaxID=180675 RepID=UPI001C265088|nr:uncharacterized protein LOC121760608 [Salvia splendens]